jgi:alkylation response protein AidB-like acyl-CoA dehydrogenase
MRRDSPASGWCPQFTEDHEAFRQLARDFVEKEIGPHYDDWEKAGQMPREVFEKLGALDMMGCRVQDTAELSFTDVAVPVANRLGEEGEAFGYLGHNLPQERMTVAVGSVAQARAAVTMTIEYVKGRVVSEHQV